MASCWGPKPSGSAPACLYVYSGRNIPCTRRKGRVWSFGLSFLQWTEEPGRLQSVGSLRVGHDWATSLHFHLQNCILYFAMLMLERYLLDIHRNRLKPTVENVYVFYLSETYQLLLWCWPVYAYFNFLFWGHHKKKTRNRWYFVK